MGFIVFLIALYFLGLQGILIGFGIFVGLGFFIALFE